METAKGEVDVTSVKEWNSNPYPTLNPYTYTTKEHKNKVEH